MAEDWPKIKTRRTTTISPWVAIIEREVEFAPGAAAEFYHAVGQQDYIAIVARTPDGKIPIVRQYRPALERFTWELPAGLVDKGESAGRNAASASSWRRPAFRRRPCTRSAPMRPAPRGCRTGCIRSSSRPARARRQAAEAGIELKLVTPAELAALIRSGEFVLQLHIGAILLAGLRGHIDLAAFSPAGGRPRHKCRSGNHPATALTSINAGYRNVTILASTNTLEAF